MDPFRTKLLIDYNLENETGPYVDKKWGLTIDYKNLNNENIKKMKNYSFNVIGVDFTGETRKKIEKMVPRGMVEYFDIGAIVIQDDCVITDEWRLYYREFDLRHSLSPRKKCFLTGRTGKKDPKEEKAEAKLLSKFGEYCEEGKIIRKVLNGGELKIFGPLLQKETEMYNSAIESIESSYYYFLYGFSESVQENLIGVS